MDPWGQISDADGTALYARLDVTPKASEEEVRSAYRRLIRVHHPDKGGDAALFAAVQEAFETLGNPSRRAVYDACGGDLRHRSRLPRAARAATEAGWFATPEGGGLDGGAAAFPATGGRAAGASSGGWVALGGEDALLDALEGLGLRCDPGTQLVVTCEVCGRPATKDCWTCGAPFCEFCTRTPHWRPGVALHWPLVNSPSLRDRLAQRELEAKRLEDDLAGQLTDSNYRTPAQLAAARTFRRAAVSAKQLRAAEQAAELGARAGRRGAAGGAVDAGDITELASAAADAVARLRAGEGTSPGPAAGGGGGAAPPTEAESFSLTRYYMWCQTDDEVIIAAHVPTGYSDRELIVEPSVHGLLVQSEGSPALIERTWAGAVDPSAPVESLSTEDRRFFAAVMRKAEGRTRWRALFRGDSDGLRALEPPYDLRESEDDVTVEMRLPFWIESSDVSVVVDTIGIDVHVRGELSLRRRFWRPADEDGGGRGRAAESSSVRDDEACPILPSESTWTLEDEWLGSERVAMLTMTLPRRPPTEEELQWKRGVRQDHREADRGDGTKGFRFFEEDDDPYGLEALLQALVFARVGRAFVPPKPWEERGKDPRWARRVLELPPQAQALLKAVEGGGVGPTPQVAR